MQITHGLLMRIFCMCYLRWTVTEFEQVWNPSNCEIWVLQKLPGKVTYELAGRWRASPYGGGFSPVTFSELKDRIRIIVIILITKRILLIKYHRHHSNNKTNN